jgi:hypothetical protein
MRMSCPGSCATLSPAATKQPRGWGVGSRSKGASGGPVLRAAWVALALWLGLLAGCGSEPVVTLAGEEVTVGCGMCLFEMEDATTCEWAVEIDGKHYWVRGPVPQDHNNHMPNGICNMRRVAIVDGELRGNLLIASRFELQPAELVPEHPRFTPADEH